MGVNLSNHTKATMLCTAQSEGSGNFYSHPLMAVSSAVNQVGDNSVKNPNGTLWRNASTNFLEIDSSFTTLFKVCSCQ